MTRWPERGARPLLPPEIAELWLRWFHGEISYPEYLGAAQRWLAEHQDPDAGGSDSA